VVLPLLIGLVRTARALGTELATKAIPASEGGKVDFAAAPRRVLVVTLQIAIVAAAGILVLAVTQPFVPAFRLAPVLLLVLALLVVAFWRSAIDLHGHAKAGAEVIAMALSRQMSAPTAAHVADRMEQLRTALPGLGEPESIVVPEGSPAANRTLAALDLRSQTGATVLTILRDGDQLTAPSGRDEIHAGDVLAIAGAHDAIEAAREVIAPAAPHPVEGDDRRR
jgi:CPA2 family monovalent cation:H+ antiporter-2